MDLSLKYFLIILKVDFNHLTKVNKWKLKYNFVSERKTFLSINYQKLIHII